MRYVECLRIALGALRVNKLRSTLTALGIIVGVGAVVCMVSVGADAEAEVTEKIRTLGANLLVILPGPQMKDGAQRESGTQPTLSIEDASALRREIGAVQVSAPLLSRSKTLVAGNKNWTTLVAGINSDYLVAREWQIADGRTFMSNELDVAAKVAVIGSKIEEELFGAQSAIGQTFRVDSVPFTVIGVLEKKGVGAAGRSQDDVVFVPLSTAMSRVLGNVRGATRDSLDFMVKASDEAEVPQFTKEIDILLRQRHHIRSDRISDFMVENPAEILAARSAAARTLSLLLIAVASISLAVGGISITNVMLVSVTERTREIGLRMAVGARRADIRMQFLMEALALATAGGVAGAILGSGAAILIAWQAGWPVLISPSAVVLSCGFAGLVGVVFGLYPANRAARLDPIVALRFE